MFCYICSAYEHDHKTRKSVGVTTLTRRVTDSTRCDTTSSRYGEGRNALLLLFLLSTLLLLRCRLGTLAADTTGASTTIWRGESEVDVTLGVETDNK